MGDSLTMLGVLGVLFCTLGVFGFGVWAADSISRHDDRDSCDNESTSKEIVELSRIIGEEQATNQRLCQEVAQLRATIRKYGLFVEDVEHALEEIRSNGAGCGGQSAVGDAGHHGVPAVERSGNGEDGGQDEGVSAGWIGPRLFANRNGTCGLCEVP